MMRRMQLKDIPPMLLNSTRTFYSLRNAYQDYDQL